MRLFCESCQQSQPPQARRGDHCVLCGLIARREQRCYWCLNHTPEGKFCRKCGAATIADHLFGAARMLKDAGVDRFTIARQLGEMDPEQVDTFSSIYAQHAAVMYCHVDQVAAAQPYLVLRHWARELEEELLAQLPWPDKRLEELRLPAIPFDGLDHLRWIREHAAFHQTRLLATLALAVATGDPKLVKTAYREIYTSGDDRLRQEAALALTHWRTYHGTDNLWDHLDIRYRDVWEDVKRAPTSKAQRARLMMVGLEPIAPEVLEDRDPDLAFMAAIGTKMPERLANAAASSDGTKRFVAAKLLLEWGAGDRASQALLQASPDHQYKLLRELARERKPAHGLKRALFEILETTTHDELRRLAGEALARDCQPRDAAEIYRLTGGNRTVVQNLLQQGNLPPETLRDLCQAQVDAGAFSADQWGMKEIAIDGRMPPDFVPKAFVNAAAPMRLQLLRFAEQQMVACNPRGLRTFVVGVAFGGFGPEPMQDAWAVLQRSHPQTGPQIEKAVNFTTAFAQEHFGSFENMLRAVTRLLNMPDEVLSHYAMRDHAANLLRYAEDGISQHIAAHPKEALLLEKALIRVAENDRLCRSLRGDAVLFLGTMAENEKSRERIHAVLSRLDKTDLHASTNLALERLDRLTATP
ncbi:MAG: hypothetical protein JNK87_39765 [Bryobacterales bacterium]|nr:hypothetical protein [Bryobacterales bacterium]